MPRAARAFLPEPGLETGSSGQSKSFPASARLRTPAQFRRVFESGQRSGDRYFGLISTDGEGPSSRLGLVIAKRHVRQAVNRSRIRRVIRESFRHHREGFGTLDIVVLARPAAATADNAELFLSLERHWKKLQS